MAERQMWIPQSTAADHARWNAFVEHIPSGHLMQSWEWGDFKASQGWTVHRIGIYRQGSLSGGVQMLFRSLPRLPLTIAYVPKGPVADSTDAHTLSELFEAMHAAARERNAIFLMIEPNWPDEMTTHSALRSCGFRPSYHTNQPRSTVIVDLRGGEATVLANMRHETRKLIRRASRDGIEICNGTMKDLGDFYQVLKSTSEVKEFPIHDQEFFEQAWSAFKEKGCLHLLLAKREGRAVAGKLLAVFGNKSLHLWGGTSPEGRQVHASYLLQWEALRWAMQRGCEFADLWGIPDEISEMLSKGQPLPKDRTGGLWGVYNFKRGFGAEIECYVGAYDYSYNRWLYQLGMVATKGNKSLDAVATRLEQISRSSRQHQTPEAG